MWLNFSLIFFVQSFHSSQCSTTETSVYLPSVKVSSPPQLMPPLHQVTGGHSCFLNLQHAFCHIQIRFFPMWPDLVLSCEQLISALGLSAHSVIPLTYWIHLRLLPCRICLMACYTVNGSNNTNMYSIRDVFNVALLEVLWPDLCPKVFLIASWPGLQICTDTDMDIRVSSSPDQTMACWIVLLSIPGRIPLECESLYQCWAQTWSKKGKKIPIINS